MSGYSDHQKQDALKIMEDRVEAFILEICSGPVDVPALMFTRFGVSSVIRTSRQLT